jgi:hypothetical protein
VYRNPFEEEVGSAEGSDDRPAAEGWIDNGYALLRRRHDRTGNMLRIVEIDWTAVLWRKD